MSRVHVFTIAALLACAGLAHGASIIEEDFARRSPDIHWPAGYTPARADLFAHNEIVVNASCAAVFRQLAAAEHWPAWYANARDVRVRGGRTQLQKGSRFEWTTFGLPVRSRVREFEPARRIGWFGKAPKLKAYHTWLLTPRDGGCFVQSEEVVLGQGARDLAKSDPAAMHSGHDLWNQALKAAVEASPM
ncbi:MAG: SRPBCC family protein [Gammaproteobacteria bacterium]